MNVIFLVGKYYKDYYIILYIFPALTFLGPNDIVQHEVLQVPTFLPKVPDNVKCNITKCVITILSLLCLISTEMYSSH